MTLPRRTHSGFYVTARLSDGRGATGSTAWLMGPFPRLTGALRMVEPVRYAACQHDSDPRLQFASYGTAKLTQPIERPLPHGRLRIVVDDVYIGKVLAESWCK